jgi:hypothetical protein
MNSKFRKEIYYLLLNLIYWFIHKRGKGNRRSLNILFNQYLSGYTFKI